jgi:hypothetical protein
MNDQGMFNEGSSSDFGRAGGSFDAGRLFFLSFPSILLDSFAGRWPILTRGPLIAPSTLTMWGDTDASTCDT